MYVEILLFFIIALIYSSAGFGGGSMYLVVLSESSQNQTFIRFTALMCNAIVTGTSSFEFAIRGWVAWRQLIGLLLFSTPICIWSSTLSFESRTYSLLLGACLLLAAIAMLSQRKTQVESNYPPVSRWWHYPASAGIGLLAGITGIGGGIYLAPLLHLSNWGNAKQIAAASAFFILINSVASIITQLITEQIILSYIHLWLALAVILGGYFGSHSAGSWLNHKWVRYITIAIIIFASIRIFIKHL
ncbi:MAG: sulfite exporter TauE/SafE family protein [Flavobacteriales bacterium]